ncbi:TetR/AcrR family transcriptional regulator [Longimicrobium sp.]|uniref:TetR/AcrR family transcriptional regulator n=1 Tax=Longimicrobium sp. TaxID=2029185 RepID=UPI003B3AE2DE
MGTKERRERERLETRDKILEAAREMFATQGVEATTMRAIAQRIEYTPTAIYHHFKDKDALIIELCHGDFAKLGRQFTQMERIEDPVERLRRIGMAYVEFAIHNPHHYQIMFMTRTPAHVHSDKNPEEDAYGFLLQTVQDGIDVGRFRPELTDAHQLAQMTWSSVHGIISLQIAKCQDPWMEWRDLRTTAKAIIDALIRGILREGQQA